MAATLASWLLEFKHVRSELLAIAAQNTSSTADAEDVLQSALVRALEHGALSAPEVNWRAWMNVVMRRLAIDLARRRRRWASAAVHDPAELPAQPREPEPSPRWSVITADQIERALAACDPMYREIYQLFHEQHLSYKEIEARLGVPAHTVGMRLLRARRQLRASLERGLDAIDA